MGTKAANTQTEPWIINATFTILVHIVAIVLPPFIQLKWQTLVLTGVFYVLATTGITIGYHRLWSHRSYDAILPLRIFIACMGTAAFQGSCLWWVRRHRMHHAYTDTVHDPYNAKQGLWHSHIGWIFQRPQYERIKLVDISDLKTDPVVMFQHKYFPILALLFAFVLPTCIAKYGWGDVIGGLVYGGFVKAVLVWHATFCINSLAHWIGEQEYSLDTSARGGFILAVITQGEGHHNYHHAFPKDYRNGMRWFDYDPTKWLISVFAMLGWAINLHTTSQSEIEKGKILVLEHKIQERRQKEYWGKTDKELVEYKSIEEVKRLCSDEGRELLVIEDLVVDVSEWKTQHPGGQKHIVNNIGRDATPSFYGTLNNHSTTAKTLLRTMAIGKFVPTSESKADKLEKEE